MAITFGAYVGAPLGERITGDPGTGGIVIRAVALLAAVMHWPEEPDHDVDVWLVTAHPEVDLDGDEVAVVHDHRVQGTRTLDVLVPVALQPQHPSKEKHLDALALAPRVLSAVAAHLGVPAPRMIAKRRITVEPPRPRGEREPAPAVEAGGASTREVLSGLAQDDSAYLVFRLAPADGDRPAPEDLGRDLHPDVLARARDVTEWDWGMLWEVR